MPTDESTDGPLAHRTPLPSGAIAHGEGRGFGMTTVLFVATIVCVVANVLIAVADYARAGFVLRNSAEVGLPVSALPYLATLKLAGAVGLAVGLVVWPWVGVAAGVGLVLFFIGAVVAHVRARVFHNIVFPGLYLILAVAAAVHMIHLAAGPLHGW
ncbi:DoxX family protein [Nocardiopsis alba]|uniref:DoxX family protein n=2 Tax=Nocardiopsis alba TaxID=53437 RepID=UPI0033CEA056